MVQVLVIGAGPAGSAAAVHLARAGLEVLLVDRCRFPRLKPCGEYYNPECVRLLRDLGVMPELLCSGARAVTALSLRTPDPHGLVVPFQEITAPGEDALTLGREALDTVLVARAQRAGARFCDGTTARAPLLDGARVAGAVLRRDGVDREVRADLILAADGLRSRFARLLGLGRGDGGRKKLGLAARYRMRADTAQRVEMHAGLPGGYFGCCGLVSRGGEANLGMVVDARAGRAMGGDPARFFDRELGRFPELREAVAGEPLGVRAVGPLTWLTSRQSLAGCLLLGDAAGFYDPFTGQGVTFALLTAALAAEVAQAALAEGDFSARRLEEYSSRRKRLLAPRIAVQQAIQAVLQRPGLRERVLERLRSRPALAGELIGVIADVVPASRVLRPGYLARLIL